MRTATEESLRSFDRLPGKESAGTGASDVVVRDHESELPNLAVSAYGHISFRVMIRLVLVFLSPMHKVCIMHTKKAIFWYMPPHQCQLVAKPCITVLAYFTYWKGFSTLGLLPNLVYYSSAIR